MTADERRTLIRRIATFPERLEEVVMALRPDVLDRSYREGGWSIRQVVHHLVDSHINGFIRMRTALVSPGSPVMGYDQDGWSELGDNREMPVEISLDLLRSLHGRWAYMLASVDDDIWAKEKEYHVFHSENGEETLEEMLVDYAGHGDHHLRQIADFAKTPLARP